jgi:hypothetical protein
MKRNKEFQKFLELKEKYITQPSKSLLEEVQEEVGFLISKGWATSSLQIVYDFSIEKYQTIGLDCIEYTIYEKDKSIRILLQQTYGRFLPKTPLNYISGKRLVFEPHKPIKYSVNGLAYANLFIKNSFLSFNPQGKRVDYVDWNRYKNITPLFENVFKIRERMNYFINWLAYGLQTLSKARTAIISKGIQGSGKGVIFEKIIQYAIGKNYTTIIENEALKSRFNGELENKLFVLANEIKSDFREGNSTYEKLKMYVSDSEIRFEDKNIRARTIPNFFNIWFHSNNDVPLQIQGSDRRYTVFNTKNRKLTEISQELGYEHISDYIKAIEKERDSFIYEIMSLKYDFLLASTPFHTEEKELIYEASMSKIEVLSDKLKKNNIDYFQDIIEEFYESMEYSNLIGELDKLNIKNPTDFVIELQKQMNGNYLKNDIAKLLYKICINESETDRKIGLQFNKYFGKAEHKKLDGKTLKYRKLDSDREVIFRKADTIIRELIEDGNLIIESEKQIFNN